MKREQSKQSFLSAIAAALIAATLAGCASFSAEQGEPLARSEMPVDHGTGGDA